MEYWRKGLSSGKTHALKRRPHLMPVHTGFCKPFRVDQGAAKSRIINIDISIYFWAQGPALLRRVFVHGIEWHSSLKKIFFRCCQCGFKNCTVRTHSVQNYFCPARIESLQPCDRARNRLPNFRKSMIHNGTVKVYAYDHISPKQYLFILKSLAPVYQIITLPDSFTGRSTGTSPDATHFIHSLEGKIAKDYKIVNKNYLGTWEEDGFSLLFFLSLL